MRMRDIQIGEDYAVKLPSIARAPRSGGSVITRATVDGRIDGKVYVFDGRSCRSVRAADVLALWDDYVEQRDRVTADVLAKVNERGRLQAIKVVDRYKAVAAWSAALDGIKQNGADLGEILRESSHLKRHVLATETLEAIAERISTLSERAVQASDGWNSPTVDTGLPVRHLPVTCPLKDEACVLYQQESPDG